MEKRLYAGIITTHGVMMLLARPGIRLEDNIKIDINRDRMRGGI
jgi:hypothetical protein